MNRKSPSPLRVAREWRGLTIRQLHEATGISTGRLSMLERGMIQPSAVDQERLARALQQTIEALFPMAPAVAWPGEAEPPRTVHPFAIA